jgi:IS5 family transposase
MLQDSYPPDKVFEDILFLIPRMDPVLMKIDHYLEDEQIYQLVKADLAKRYSKTLKTGRNSTPVEVIIRMLVVKMLYHCSYAETERLVSDSLVLRQFCRVYLKPVPDDTTLIKWANLIQAETLQQFNERITQLALEYKVTKGKKLRTDGTVIETHIHLPSDNRQLADSVRVLARTIECAKKIPQLAIEVKDNFTQAARHLSRKIGEILKKRSEEAKGTGKKLYQELVEMTQETVKQAQQTLEQCIAVPEKPVQRLKKTLEIFIPLAQAVIDQTQRRVFENEAVPAQEKIVSIFEPHSDIIVRGKDSHPVEYGHKVWLNEVDGGIVSHYRILEGNPSDELQWLPSLQAHQKTFNVPPEQASADRGLSSASNEKVAQDMHIEKVILPKRGNKSQQRREYEHQEWFVEGRKWHAGVEGRISVLKRAHGLGRCLNHGFSGFQRWVGWGVIAGNLAVMGRA